MTTPSRRSFLRGAGALMALPFLQSLPARALAQAAGAAIDTAAAGGPPLRMGIFTVTGGTVIESWRLPQAGPLTAATKLPSILRPLDFAKQDMLLISGLAQGGKAEGLNAHEHCAFTHLTGAPEVKKVGGRIMSSVSVDQVAARAVGDQTVLPSIEMGLTSGETKYSFRGPDAPVPYEANPRLVFDRMFRGRKPVVPNWSRRAAALQQTARETARGDSYDKSVVDLVLGDAKDLRGKLGGTDRQRLDEYLESVRSVEKRIDSTEARRRVEALDAADPGPSRLNVPDPLPEVYSW